MSTYVIIGRRESATATAFYLLLWEAIANNWVVIQFETKKTEHVLSLLHFPAFLKPRICPRADGRSLEVAPQETTQMRPVTDAKTLYLPLLSICKKETNNRRSLQSFSWTFAFELTKRYSTCWGKKLLHKDMLLIIIFFSLLLTLKRQTKRLLICINILNW